MTRLAPALAILLLLSGCAGLGQRESFVVLPSGQKYLVGCQSDGMVDYAQGDVKLKVDNRGRPGVFEQLLGTVTLGVMRDRDLIKEVAK